MTKVIDFDAFRAEQKAEPLELKIGGKTFTLPSALPATLVVDVIRRNTVNADEEFEAEELVKMGQAIFGSDEAFNTLLNEGAVTVTELPELFKMIFAAYTSDGEPDAPNSEIPVKAAKVSSR